MNHDIGMIVVEDNVVTSHQGQKSFPTMREDNSHDSDLTLFLEIALRAFNFTPVGVKEDLDISDEEFDRLHKKLKAYMGEGA